MSKADEAYMRRTIQDLADWYDVSLTVMHMVCMDDYGYRMTEVQDAD